MDDRLVWFVVVAMLGAMVGLIYLGVRLADRAVRWADRRDAAAAKRAEQRPTIEPSHRWSRR